MSQEKVEQSKKLKQDRKKIVKRNKVKITLAEIIGVLVMITIVCWLGYSIYEKYEAKQVEARRSIVTEINLKPLSDYLTALATEGAADAVAADDAEATDEPAADDAEAAADDAAAGSDAGAAGDGAEATDGAAEAAGSDAEAETEENDAGAAAE